MGQRNRKKSCKAEPDWVWKRLRCGFRLKIDREDSSRFDLMTWRSIRKNRLTFKIVCSIRTKQHVRQVTLGRYLLNYDGPLRVKQKPGFCENDFRKSSLEIYSDEDVRRLSKKTTKPTSSRFKGVSKTKTGWRAMLEKNGRCKAIGTFKTEEEAAKAYDSCALIFFGANCFTNFEAK